MSRTKLIAANWKMYKTPAEAKAFVEAFLPLVAGHTRDEIALFPSPVLLPTVIEAAKGSNVAIGCQNMHFAEEGAYTARGPDLNGNQVRMRKDDGIHYSAAGADKLAFYVNQVLRNYYRGGGTVGIEVADPLFGTDAQLMLRPPYQGLGQMKLLEVAGAVIPLTGAIRRSTDLITAESVGLTPVGFDITQMLQAPVGRADAFGVGKTPGDETLNLSGR